MLLISSSEDRYDLSHRHVPARVLPSLFAGTALASWQAPSPAFPLQSRSCAPHGAPSAQATYPKRLPGLSSRLHALVGWGTSICACAPLARGQKPAESPPLGSTRRASPVPTSSARTAGLLTLTFTRLSGMASMGRPSGSRRFAARHATQLSVRGATPLYTASKPPLSRSPWC
jgi:hypothetical protein